jgi:hypothetical protein
MNNFVWECKWFLFSLYLSLPNFVLQVGIPHTIPRNYNMHNNYSLCTPHMDCTHSILSKPVLRVLIDEFR